MCSRLLTFVVAAAMVAVMPLSVFADAVPSEKISAKSSQYAQKSGLEKLGRLDSDLNSKIDVSHLTANGYVRIYGANRYETAFEVAELFRGEWKGAIVASGLNYPDALGAGALAGRVLGPVILTGPGQDRIAAETITQDILPQNVGACTYVMGGTGAVSDDFIKNYNSIRYAKQSVTRVAGADRYSTNIATLKKLREIEGPKSSWDKKVLVCSGKGFADSLSASAAGWPILLVGDSLTSAQRDYLKTQGAEDIILIGGTGAVSSTIENQIRGLGTGAKVQRIYGSNRYATSYAIAKSFIWNEDSDEMVLAYAQNFPDGLSGCTLAFSVGGPLLLCDSNNMSWVKRYVNEEHVTGAYVLGGPSLISDAAVKNLHMEAN